MSWVTKGSTRSIIWLTLRMGVSRLSYNGGLVHRSLNILISPSSYEWGEKRKICCRFFLTKLEISFIVNARVAIANSCGELNLPLGIHITVEMFVTASKWRAYGSNWSFLMLGSYCSISWILFCRKIWIQTPTQLANIYWFKKPLYVWWES